MIEETREPNIRCMCVDSYSVMSEVNSSIRNSKLPRMRGEMVKPFLSLIDEDVYGSPSISAMVWYITRHSSQENL